MGSCVVCSRGKMRRGDVYVEVMDTVLGSEQIANLGELFAILILDSGTLLEIHGPVLLER